jgi:hypothetical protein
MKTTFEISVDDYVYSCDRNVWLAIPHALNSFEDFGISALIKGTKDLNSIHAGVMRPLNFCHVFEQELRDVVDDYEY